MTRWRVLLATALGTLGVIAAGQDARPAIVWNATASAPRGFYRVVAADRISVGDLVLIRPDPARARLFADRGYLPIGVPLLKRVAAVAGQKVCKVAGRVSIDGVHRADALARDGQGRPLVAWSGCRRLATGEIFVLVPDVPASLDGRYFGPTPLSAVIGRALPVWIRDAP